MEQTHQPQQTNSKQSAGDWKASLPPNSLMPLQAAVTTMFREMHQDYPRTFQVAITEAGAWAATLQSHNIPAAFIPDLYRRARDRRLQDENSYRRDHAPEVGDLVFDWVQVREAQRQKDELRRTEDEMNRQQLKAAETKKPVEPGSARERFMRNWGGDQPIVRQVTL